MAVVQRLSRARYPTVQSDNAERSDADIDCIIDTIDSILHFKYQHVWCVGLYSDGSTTHVDCMQCKHDLANYQIREEHSFQIVWATALNHHLQLGH